MKGTFYVQHLPKPRDATSVAIRMGVRPCLNSEKINFKYLGFASMQQFISAILLHHSNTFMVFESI